MNSADVRAALLRTAIGRRALVVPESATWDRWLWLARIESAGPLLYRIVDAVPTDLDDEQRRQLRQLQGSVLARCVQLEHHLLEIVRLLAAAGIRSVVLKGGATAHLDYPDPSWRAVNDIDLLIDPVDRAVATDVVTRAGWAQGYALPRGHDEFTHAITFVRDRMELDLHQRVAHRALGLRIPTPDLLAGARPFEIAGRTVFALNDVDRLIHSAIHSLTSRGAVRRLSSAADVLLAVHRRPGLAFDVLARAERWRVRSLVEQAVRDAHQAAALALPAAWVEAMRRPIVRHDRALDRAYLGPERRAVHEELAHLRLLPGWRSRWRYVTGFLAIEPAYATQHGRPTRRAQLRYVLQKLRSRIG